MFHSPGLQEAYDASIKKINSIASHMDIVSEDIKALESKLQESNAGTKVTIDLGRTTELTSKEKDSYDKLGWTPKHWVEQKLHWAKCPVSGKFRLMYERIFELDYPSAGSWGDNDVSVTPEIRPVVETPVKTRLVCHKALPKLILELASLV